MKTTTRTRTNKYAANCASCSRPVAAGTGRLVNEEGAWLVLCADTADCAAAEQARVADRETRLEAAQEMAKAEYARRKASGENPSWLAVLAEMQAQTMGRTTTTTTPTTSSRRTSASRRRACVSGGNCSSTTGHDCGGHDCDAN